MSYYNLIKENYKFFQNQLKKNSDIDSDVNNIMPINENLNGGSKPIKYQVIDFDWDDLIAEDEEDVFLYSTSKDIEFSNKKIKEPTKEEVYDELLNNDQQIEFSFTGEMDDLNDQNIDQDNDQIDNSNNTTIENILSDEAAKELNENSEDDEKETSESSDDDVDSISVQDYFGKDQTISALKNNDEIDLADIDDIINNYFESFENVQGGRSIDKIKEILADDTEYKNSLNLTGGNFKVVRKSKMNRLYPYN